MRRTARRTAARRTAARRIASRGNPFRWARFRWRVAPRDGSVGPDAQLGRETAVRGGTGDRALDVSRFAAGREREDARGS